MRLLVMGGTWFPGRHIAEAALAREWDVTTFNRGRSGRDVPGANLFAETEPLMTMFVRL